MENYWNRKVVLKSSDNFPPQGWLIKPRVIAKIKKEVSRPSQVSFTASEEDGKTLMLNGKESVEVAPAASPLDVTKLVIRQPGKLLK